MVVPREKISKVRHSEGLKCCLRLVFANKVFCTRAILPIFSEKFNENVLGIFTYLESTIGPAMAGPGEEFSKLRLMDDWRAVF